MRRAPLNYIITIAVGALLWVATGIFLGKMLGDSVALQAYTTDSFLSTFRMTTAVISLLAILIAAAWYGFGARKQVAGAMKQARQRWVLSFALEAVLAALGIVALAISFRTEGVSGGDYAIVSFVLAVDTIVFFWVCTFLMSPPSVEFIPWGKR